MKQQLQEDIKTAMKGGDKERLIVLRGLMSEIKKKEIDTKSELNAEQCIGVVQKEIKARRDTIEFAEKAGRDEMVAKEKKEIEFLQAYLGDQLSEDKLRELIAALIAGGADNIGKIMGALNKDYKGQFEGKQASVIVKELLENQ
ncbi:MAG: GatB/YqeY domain-containing protein [Bdellovibrionales bacterium]|nr:GatB/YqeY domain-containing protein [Bdellovibrionales bacterium]